MSENLEITKEILDKLSDKERELALSILDEFSKNGESKKFANLLYEDFDEIPVDITTFLHDKTYLGNALYDQDGRFTLFPYWEETLKDIFPTNIDTKYNTIIFTGAIGLGKSTIAVICLLYILYRLLCLKDPYLYYGLQPIDKLTISFMNITLENAKGVALDKMNQMLLSSAWFMSHGEMSGETNLIYRPNKHIEVVTASSNNQIIGRCLDGDTLVKTLEGDFTLNELVGKHVNIYSIDDKNKEIINDSCVVEPTVKSNEEYQIELEDGSILRCTPNHLFMLKDGSYKEAKDLTTDDEFYDIILKPFGYIYLFTNLITNKIYIGKREKEKFDESYYGSGKLWKQDLNKYGKNNIKREILCFCSSRKELNKLEEYYIKLYNSRDKDIGYNIHKGGQGGNSLGDTEEWSKLHRGSRNGRYHKEVTSETRKKISNSNKGKIRTTEFKMRLSSSTRGKKKPMGFGEKISKSLKGRKATWNYKKVLCEETGNTYNSVVEAEKITNICRQNISRACIKHSTAGGFHWRYLNEN